MSEAQLTVDGREVDASVAPVLALNDRQREVLRYVRAKGEVRSYEIGVMMHAGREGGCRHVGYSDGPGWHLACCRYACDDGLEALHRLERRGLVFRVARGRWRAVPGADESWTRPIVPAAERVRIVELYRRGLSQRAIGAQLFRSATTVGAVLRAAGIPGRSNINRHARLDELDPDSLMATVELYGRGYTAHEVAEALGVSDSTVRYRIAKYSRDGLRHGSAAHTVPRERRRPAAGAEAA